MDLRSCYFCGAVGESLEARSVLPPRFAADAADPPRVVLCTGCHTKLLRVFEAAAPHLDPASAAAESDTRTPASAETPDAADAPDPDQPSDRADRAGGGRGFEFTPEVTFGATDATDPAADAGETTAADDTVERDAEGESDRPGEPAGVDAVPGAATSETAEQDDPPSESATPSAGEGANGDETDTDESAPLRGPGASTSSPYRKALRLLQNRTFPMERAAVVDVMSSAYDLELEECERIVDFAVERDLLVEDGSRLRRP